MSDLNNVIRKIKPCDNYEPYVFISYSSADRELVWRDVLEFQRRGYNVWLDEKNLDKTKDSWKEDALTAIEDMDCVLLVFYVSEYSLRSDACYQELSKTVADSTKAMHFGPVKFIAIDAEAVGDIKTFHQKVFEKIRTSDLDKEERKKQALALNGFMQQFFNSNNEKVRIHPKNEENRKMDYYEEILASFPDESKIYPDETAVEAEAVESKPAEAEPVQAEPEEEIVAEVTAPAHEEKAVAEAAEPEPEEKAVAEAAEPAHEEEVAAEGAAREPEEEAVAEAAEPAPEEETITEVEATDSEEETTAEVAEPEPEEKTAAEAAAPVSEEKTAAEAVAPGPEEKAAAVEELAEETEPSPDYFTHYEERPKNRKYTRNPFRKKNMKEAQQGSGIYRLVTGYTSIDIQIFGSIFGGKSDIVRMDLPDSIETLNIGEFRDCVNMKEIRMPKYLEKISYEAFKGCSSLTAMDVPGNVSLIEGKAFQGCSSLRRVKLPEGLKKIGNSAFEGCCSLEEIHLPPTLEEIDITCFSHCTSLTEVTIPGTIKKISSSAFDGCTALKKVVIEEGVEEIDAAFGKGINQLQIWIPASVVKISSIAFYKSIAIIHCDANSYAQSYAEKERISYILNE